MISRRVFLAGSASTLALAACGDDTSRRGAPTGVAELDELAGDPQLRPAFASGLGRTPAALVAGIPQRAPLVVVDELGRFWRDGLPSSFGVEVRREGSVVATTTVHRHDRGIPMPYYPLELDFPEPAEYEAAGEVSPVPARFRVAPAGEVALVQVGERLRPVATPTFADARGVNPICTRLEPCPFHEVSLDEAMEMGRPLVLIVSTPGFCQTGICGPVLELLIEAAGERPELAMVHAEVYEDPNAPSAGLPETTEAVATYGLTFEPSMLVAGADGVVTARLDFTWDQDELTRALDTVAA